MTDTYVTSATQYIDAEGMRYAYRRFGRETGVPLILFQNLGREWAMLTRYC
jgi:hypothetical protein